MVENTCSLKLRRVTYVKHCSEASNYSMSVPNCSTASTIEIGVEKRKAMYLDYLSSPVKLQLKPIEFLKGTEILCT